MKGEDVLSWETLGRKQGIGVWLKQNVVMLLSLFSWAGLGCN